MLEPDCRTVVNGSYSSTPIQIIENELNGVYNNGYATVGNKNPSKKRSVFVNGRINGAGGFAPIYNRNYQSTDKVFINPNQEGAEFAIDLGGTLCDYERELQLLGWLQANQVDEINLYNIEDLLQEGNKFLEPMTSQEILQYLPDYEDKGWLPPSGNLLTEREKVEFHLLRFVHRAKSQYNLKVNFILSGASSVQETEEFYDFNHNAGGEDPQFPLREICQQYITVASFGSGKRSGTDSPYFTYSDAPFLIRPRDSLGRISYLDKAIIDIVNFHIYNVRAHQQLITPTPQSCTGPINASNCTGTFDAILFEWEWWDTPSGMQADDPNFFPDAELLQLKELINFYKCFANDEYSSCEPKVYGCADRFSRTQSTHNWVNNVFTPQERANYVDQIFDRIYLYSYHKNPCHSYNGLGTSNTTEKDWNYKASLLNNNNRGGLINSQGERETEIYPVFHAEFHESDVNVNYHWTKAREYAGTVGNQTIGCDNSSSHCDYCADYGGRFMNDLQNHIASNPNVSNPNGNRMGFIENIFQHEFDMDGANTPNPSLGTNQINGYSWFKSGTLRKNNVTGKTALSANSDAQLSNEFKVYPNPAKNRLQLEIDPLVVKSTMIYDLAGKVMFRQESYTNAIDIAALQAGTYFVSVIQFNSVVQTQKFLKQ